jgi:ubiquinone/menaquinone biosynthesis C-methylase UbiE
VPPYRDVAEFNDRAASYDHGWRGRLHHEIADRTASLALATVATPNRVLDLGCGTGYLLRTLAGRYRYTEQFASVDAAPAMVKTANTVAQDDRLTFAVGRRRTDRLPRRDVRPDRQHDLLRSLV